MLTEKIEGASLEELRALTPQDIFDMLGVEIGPARQRCALLSYACFIRVSAERIRDSLTMTTSTRR